MCPIPPTAIYDSIANDPKVPQELQDVARTQLKQAAFQDIVNNATLDVGAPSTGNNDFTCTIYSLENKKILMAGVKLGTDDNPNAFISLPGTKVFDTKGFVAKDTNGNVIPDPGRKLAVEGFRAAYNFYKTVFGRNSIDDRGLEMRATIHFGRANTDASWNGNKKQMILGDAGRWDGRGWLVPDKRDMENLETAKKKGWSPDLQNWYCNYDLDTIGHELTHGVVGNTAKLGKDLSGAAYSEAGTLNEHIADCFGVMLKHFVNKHTVEKANWEFSPGQWSRMTMKHKGWEFDYCRTFKLISDKDKTKSPTNPDEYPQHWNKKIPFDDGTREGLDPHVNTQIGNHAFYRAALAFKDYPVASLPDKDYSWKTVGKIWYDALIDDDFKDPKKQNFNGWRDLTVKYAKKHFGVNGEKSMVDAWAAVGL